MSANPTGPSLPQGDRATADRIRDAALACFAQDGIDATTLRGIVRRAGVSAGTLTPSRDLRSRAAVMTLWSLGALVLNRHVQRVLGTDLTAPSVEEAHRPGYVRPAMEILSHGLLTPAMVEPVRDAFEDGDA
ncbi:MAG: TetR family transcriptional regulator [Trueperaceae bacterium]